MTRRAAIVAALLALTPIALTPIARAQSSGDQPPSAAPRLTKPPKLVHFVEAPYPEAERAAKRTASVVLKLTITDKGTIADAVVMTSGGPAFDAAAKAAALQFVFEPAEIDNHPSAIKILYKYAFTLKPEKPTTAIYAGSVRNRANYKPLPGVTVLLDTKQTAVTKLDGTFEIPDVKPGPHGVSLSGGGLTTLLTNELFEAGQRLEVTYDVALPAPAAAGDQEDIEIIVTPPPVEKHVQSTAVSAAQAVQVPGTQGDVLKVVESMPGVARAQVGSSALIVWGAAPKDTRTYVDGVPIPELYHLGGLRSVLASDFVQGVELVPGGYGAAHGNGLGGIVLVDLKPLENDGIHASAAADIFQASAMFRAPITDKLRFEMAGEYSYVDELASAFVSPTVEEFFPFPRYHDAQARLHYQLTPRESLELVFMYSGDVSQSGVPNSDPGLVTKQTNNITFYRVYLKYENQVGNGSSITVTPYFGLDQSLMTESVGSVSTFVQNNTTLGGLRAAWHGIVTEWLLAEGGLDAEIQSAQMARVGSLLQPAREGDPYVFGEPIPGQLNADNWNVIFVNLGPYAELDFKPLKDNLHITPGVRIDPYARAISRAEPTASGVPPTGIDQENFGLEPRLAARWDINKWVGVRAAVGQYHEQPAPEDLSAVFGNPTLPVSIAQQFLAGTTVHMTKTLSGEITGFYEQSQQLAMRNASPTPLAGQALEDTGLGREYGMQVLIRQELLKGFFGWVSYTLSRSERQDAPGDPWRLSDYDQTHLLTLAAAYDIGHGFNVGVRFRYATGFPRTQVIGSYYDTSIGQYEPIFSTNINNIRIPPFEQLDIRASKEWKVGKNHLELSLDIQNVTDQANPEEIVYSSDFTQKSYITGLPIMPVLGFRWSM